MAHFVPHTCVVCSISMKYSVTTFRGLHILQRGYYSAALLKESMVKKQVVSYNKSLSLTKYMMLQRLLATRTLSNLIESCRIQSSLERKYSIVNFYTSTGNKCHVQKNVAYCTPCHSDLTRNMTARTNISASANKIPRSHTDRGTLILHHKDISRLQFSSSAITNIDNSDSSTKPNIFQRLYQKVMPEKLSVPKSALYKSGATLSSCCTHEVS